MEKPPPREGGSFEKRTVPSGESIQSKAALCRLYRLIRQDTVMPRKRDIPSDDILRIGHPGRKFRFVRKVREKPSKLATTRLVFEAMTTIKQTVKELPFEVLKRVLQRPVYLAGSLLVTSTVLASTLPELGHDSVASPQAKPPVEARLVDETAKSIWDADSEHDLVEIDLAMVQGDSLNDHQVQPTTYRRRTAQSDATGRYRSLPQVHIPAGNGTASSQILPAQPDLHLQPSVPGGKSSVVILPETISPTAVQAQPGANEPSTSKRVETPPASRLQPSPSTSGSSRITAPPRTAWNPASAVSSHRRSSSPLSSAPGQVDHQQPDAVPSSSSPQSVIGLAPSVAKSPSPTRRTIGSSATRREIETLATEPLVPVAIKTTPPEDEDFSARAVGVSARQQVISGTTPVLNQEPTPIAKAPTSEANSPLSTSSNESLNRELPSHRRPVQPRQEEALVANSQPSSVVQERTPLPSGAAASGLQDRLQQQVRAAQDRNASATEHDQPVASRDRELGQSVAVDPATESRIQESHRVADRRFDRHEDELASDVEHRRYDDPRYADPRYADPRYADPRYADPRYADSREEAPRFDEPYRDSYRDPRMAPPAYRDRYDRDQGPYFNSRDRYYEEQYYAEQRERERMYDRLDSERRARDAYVEGFRRAERQLQDRATETTLGLPAYFTQSESSDANRLTTFDTLVAPTNTELAPRRLPSSQEELPPRSPVTSSPTVTESIDEVFCCDPCCNPIRFYTGAEAAILFPILSSSTASVMAADSITQFSVDQGTASLEGNLNLSPRVWFGLQRGKWGVETRFFNFNDSEHYFSPEQPHIARNYSSMERIQAWTADVEVFKKWCTHHGDDRRMSFGFRWADLESSNESTMDYFTNNTFALATAMSSRKFSGPGVTLALSGAHRSDLCCTEADCCSVLKCYWGIRGSVIIANVTNYAHTDAVVFDPVLPATAATINTGVGEGDDTAFLAEANLGLLYEHPLACSPATFFVRGGVEYQFWGSDGAFAAAGSSAFSNNVTISSYANSDDLNLQLIGGVLGFGLTW